MSDFIYIVIVAFLLFGIIMFGHFILSDLTFNNSDTNKKKARVYTFGLALIVSCIIRYSYSLILGDVDELNENLFNTLYELEEVKDRLTALEVISDRIRAIDTYYDEEQYSLNQINYEIASELDCLEEDLIDEIYSFREEIFYNNSEIKEKYETYYKNKKGKKSDQYAPQNTVETTTYKAVVGNNIPLSKNTDNSTCFTKVLYVSKSKSLIVVFRESGAAYVYYNVPRDVWNKLLNADSMGNYYNNNIKNEYVCNRITDY